MTNPVIDIHSHVFNAGYVPLEGIFRSRLKKKYHPWATRVARLLEGALERDESLPDSFFALPGLRARLIGFDDEAAVDHFITAFVGAVTPEYLDSHAADIEEAVTILRAADPSLPEVRDEEPGRLPTLSRGDLRAGLRWLLKHLVRLIEGGAALVSWILLLLGRESRLYDVLVGTWPTTSLFVHHMMDMDNHYPPGRSLYPFVTLQMRRMRILAQRAGGRLLGFVAYDPFREAGKDENEAVAVVEQALKRGFAGVKFYPPSGYKPLGNTKKDMSHSGKDPSRINAVNERLFKLCVDLDAPVFAHCSPGEMERWKGAGLFADPKYWRDVLEQPRFKNLRLCFGHAGGDAGWCAKPGVPVDPDFVPEVVRLCQTYPNVYCEFGHTEQLFVESNRPYFARRLADAVTATGVRYDFGTKIMYGSDWHLLARAPDVEDFDDVFRKIFRGNQTLAKYEHQFFGLNALRYLNLADFLNRNSGSLTRQEFEYLSFLAAP